MEDFSFTSDLVVAQTLFLAEELFLCCVSTKLKVFFLSKSYTSILVSYNVKACFLAHTLPDCHSASKVNEGNTLGNIPKLTQYYPSPDFRKSGENIG